MADWSRGIICGHRRERENGPIVDQILDLGLLAPLTNGLIQPVKYKLVIPGTQQKVSVWAGISRQKAKSQNRVGSA